MISITSLVFVYLLFFWSIFHYKHFFGASNFPTLHGQALGFLCFDGDSKLGSKSCHFSHCFIDNHINCNVTVIG